MVAGVSGGQGIKHRMRSDLVFRLAAAMLIPKRRCADNFGPGAAQRRASARTRSVTA